jgi:hypothetical protein
MQQKLNFITKISKYNIKAIHLSICLRLNQILFKSKEWLYKISIICDTSYIYIYIYIYACLNKRWNIHSPTSINQCMSLSCSIPSDVVWCQNIQVRSIDFIAANIIDRSILDRSNFFD